DGLSTVGNTLWYDSVPCHIRAFRSRSRKFVLGVHHDAEDRRRRLSAVGATGIRQEQESGHPVPAVDRMLIAHKLLTCVPARLPGQHHRCNSRDHYRGARHYLADHPAVRFRRRGGEGRGVEGSRRNITWPISESYLLKLNYALH